MVLWDLGEGFETGRLDTQILLFQNQFLMRLIMFLESFLIKYPILVEATRLHGGKTI